MCAAFSVWGVLEKSVLFGFAAAAASAAGALTGAGGAVGAADTFFAALFGFVDGEGGSAQDQPDYGNDDIIYCVHNLLLSAEGILSFDFFVGTDTQP